jgi:hypothetical protein
VSPRRKRPTSILQLEVTLLEVEPPVWRRLLVPSDITLARLHPVLQEAMGWTNSHLHQFVLRDRRFSDPRFDDTGELEFEDERKVTLGSLVGPGQALVYEYDFGDGWEHQLQVEQALEPDARLSYPLCTGGARACPPEDVGGPPGYEDFLKALRNPEHEEHDETLTWIGGAFDPEGFDLNRINAALRALK